MDSVLSKEQFKVINKLSKSKTFCTKAWGGLSISPSGAMTPCCLFERPICDQNNKAYRVWESDIQEVYNSEFMQDVRKKMLKGEDVPACRQCYQAESYGEQSLRTTSNKEQYEFANHYKLDQPILPVSLDLKMNNKCNLRCRMCQPRDSHLIEKEFSEIIEENTDFGFFSNTALIDPDVKIPLVEIPQWSHEQKFKESFIKMLPSLKKISVVGGEPLILEDFYTLLEWCIDEGKSHEIYLCLTTNLMSVPLEKIKRLFPHFSHSLINISLDATGKELEYIRYPSRFERIVNNYKKLYQSESLKNIDYIFTPTVQVYNILYLADIYKFIDELLEQDYFFPYKPLHLTFLEFPEHLNIRCLPTSIREKAIEKLKKAMSETKFLKENDFYLEQHDQLLRILECEHFENQKEIFAQFLYYTEVLDSKRGQRMQDYLDELYESIALLDISAKAPEELYTKIREKGWRLAKLGFYEKAIAHFEKSLTMSPDKYLDYREMAWMKMELKDFDAAYNLYKKGLKLNAKDPYLKKGLRLVNAIRRSKKSSLFRFFYESKEKFSHWFKT
ncbi:MAG: twitch domain-containing radical SAM protein [Bacteriovoracaceae bacterium]|jgi:molybdenum cofactor biosynthesis enzyme MoaA|nr:twitch domain-containing radical SAM protein [Bacteriovoracaceae bacterium]